MPVWQQFYEDNQDRDIEILSVAIDVQGADIARPYVEASRAAFTTVVDEQNLLGQLYGFNAIPNGFLIDERGIVRYKKLGGFDIREADTKAVVDRWAGASGLGDLVDTDATELGPAHSEANSHFRRGQRLYSEGKTEAAVVEWHRGVALEPDNYIIRKQIWAVENPEKFYSGDVDFDWQDVQMEKGL